MQICHVQGYYDPEFLFARKKGHEVLQAHPLSYHLPVELARLGHQITVLHHFYRDEIIEDSGVRFEFLSPHFLPAVVGKTAGYFFQHYRFPYFQAATSIRRRLDALKPELIHYFGLTMAPNLWLVSRWAHRNGAPVVVHYHGGSPARHWLARRIERNNLRRLSRVLFTTVEQAADWQAAGLPPEKVRQLLETSSAFTPEERVAARRRTGLEGAPIFVSAGRLHPIKDPFTVLRGFEKIAAAWPEAKLYFFYRTAELLAKMEKTVAANPLLAQRVKFCGEAAHSQMQAIFSSADFLLQASRREFSGCAVLEAMACGAIPVVTDIPPFRVMTESGRYGLLFSPGDPDALAAKVLNLNRQEICSLSLGVREKFLRDLSFPALAKKLEEIYRELTSASISRRANI
jgi:glycosyltransferase involved in cell wall biosynthesis